LDDFFSEIAQIEANPEAAVEAPPAPPPAATIAAPVATGAVSAKPKKPVQKVIMKKPVMITDSERKAQENVSEVPAALSGFFGDAAAARAAEMGDDVARRVAAAASNDGQMYLAPGQTPMAMGEQADYMKQQSAYTYTPGTTTMASAGGSTASTKTTAQQVRRT
jgi:hypothetical protein